MAFTEIYVDPSIAGDSGAGTSADPYGDLEYAIEQETFDLTNGTRVNIKAGTAEVLAAELDAALADTGTSIAWVPTETAPLIFQGYTTAAADGGKGAISGGGAVEIISTTKDYITFKDLVLSNTGAATVVLMDDFCSVINCEIHTSTGSGLDLDSNCFAIGNYVHVTGATNKYGIKCDSGAWVEGNYIVMGTDMSHGIYLGALGGVAYRNIITLTGTASSIKYGISIIAGSAIQNSIYSSGAHLGAGISIPTNDRTNQVRNNLIEGFSGTGGRALATGTQTSLGIFGGNAEFNCNIGFEAPSEYILHDYGDNETLTASPFTSASTLDFSPVDTGNVKEGALPQDFGDGAI